jgi:short-subunit dehydrogenase
MTRALVTGASAGIGAAFARRLAGDGFVLVLVARTRSRLEQAVPDLRHRGSPHIEVLPADLADAAERARVVARLTGSNRPIDLIVNNAGMALGKGLLDATEEELAAQLELNVHAVMLLSHAALPGMIKRRHGGVVNIASVAGLTPGRGSTY